jgi:hypothetical protein
MRLHRSEFIFKSAFSKANGKWLVELANPVRRIGWLEVSREVVRDEEFRCIGYEFAPAFCETATPQKQSVRWLHTCLKV